MNEIIYLNGKNIDVFKSLFKKWVIKIVKIIQMI